MRVRRGLLNDAEAVLLTVAHLDAEVLSGLARLNLAGASTIGEVDELLRRLARLDARRVPITGALVEAAWRMRDNLTARDALYVAVARGLGCTHPGLQHRSPSDAPSTAPAARAEADDHDPTGPNGLFTPGRSGNADTRVSADGECPAASRTVPRSCPRPKEGFTSCART